MKQRLNQQARAKDRMYNGLPPSLAWSIIIEGVPTHLLSWVAQPHLSNDRPALLYCAHVNGGLEENREPCFNSPGYFLSRLNASEAKAYVTHTKVIYKVYPKKFRG